MNALQTLPRLTGCPCGCGYKDPCITTTPLPTVDAAPCSGACRGMGWEGITYWAKTLGHCPCGDREAFAS